MLFLHFFMSDGMDKHMSEPMIITLTDLSLAVFCNCVGYLEILRGSLLNF